MPFWSELLFVFATAWGIFWAYMAGRSRAFLLIIAAIGVGEYLLVGSGFFADTTSFPPRQAALLQPMVLTLVICVLLPTGRRWMAGHALVPLVMLNVLRIPVELVLHEAYLQGQVPRGMTYSGHNFDILSGISAALMAAWLLSRRPPSRGVLIGWNLVCLGLLINVVVTAVFSIPSSVQRWDLDQPNVLVLATPYVLLPAVLVPLVLWSHLAMLVKLSGTRTRQA